jgi:hypothetical protein
LLIRLRILETPLFAALKDKNEVATAPVRETIRNHWRDLLLIAGTRITENASFYLFTAWAFAYDAKVLKLADTGLFRQANEQPQRLVRDAILGVIEVDATRFERQAASALRIVGKELPQMQRSDLLGVCLELLPGGTLSE